MRKMDILYQRKVRTHILKTINVSIHMYNKVALKITSSPGLV